jgi:hypothetical protein
LNENCILPGRIDAALALLPIDVTVEKDGKKRTVLAPWWGVHEALRAAAQLCREGDYDKGHVRFQRVLGHVKKSSYKFELPLDFTNALFAINDTLLGRS